MLLQPSTHVGMCQQHKEKEQGWMHHACNTRNAIPALTPSSPLYCLRMQVQEVLEHFGLSSSSSSDEIGSSSSGGGASDGGQRSSASGSS